MLLQLLNMMFLPFIAGKFFMYLVFMFLTFTYFTFYGMMAVGLTPTQQLAAVVSSAFYSLWNLLSGFLIPKPVSKILCITQQIILSFFSGKLSFHVKLTPVLVLHITTTLIRNTGWGRPSGWSLGLACI